ncbi:hypothetical protein BC830DRAFT_36409 [Chytriomyces sp. MP71]|nr:hypothetical protein BC830DRAFT_36409 [Chytriomyces sp. MP71]
MSKADCFSMAASSVCGPAFAGQLLYLNSSDPLRDVAGFDGYMQNSMVDTSSGWISNMAAYGCPKYAGAGLRYHITAFCAVWAYQGGIYCTAEGAQAPAAPVCGDSVTAFLHTFTALLNNNTLCNTPTAQESADRNAYSSLFKDALDRANFPFNPTSCLRAVPGDESAYCGFHSIIEAQTFCYTNPSDPCCPSLLGSLQPSATPFSPTGSLSDPGIPILTSFPVVPVAIGGAVGLLVVCILFYCLFARCTREPVILKPRDVGGLERAVMAIALPRTETGTSVVKLDTSVANGTAEIEMEYPRSRLPPQRGRVPDTLSRGGGAPSASLPPNATVSQARGERRHVPVSDSGRALGESVGMSRAMVEKQREAEEFMNAPFASSPEVIHGGVGRMSNLRSNPKAWSEERVAQWILENGGTRGSVRIAVGMLHSCSLYYGW